MASIMRHTALEPLLTGPLLWILTRGSVDLRARILRPLASLPYHMEVSTMIRTLKWLFALGLASRINALMTQWAAKNWMFNTGGRPWSFAEEVAVITGGSGGIGSELVKKLAATGMKVAIMDLQPPPASLNSLRNVSFYKCDIGKPQSVTEVASSIKADFGSPTILVNNAGIAKTFSVLDVPNDYLEKIMHINLISHWYTVKEFLPDMITGKKGHIISIASMASYTSVAGMVDYCVTKAGVMSFHEGLTQELKHRYNAPFIQTTAVHPYWVRTALINDWEETLGMIKHPIMTPEFVAGHIARQIFSGKSGHLILPPSGLLSAVTGARGWPKWLHELINDRTKQVTVAHKQA